MAQGFIDLLFVNVEVWGPQCEGCLAEADSFHVIGIAEHHLPKDRLGSVMARFPRFSNYAIPAAPKSKSGTTGRTMAMVQRNLPSAEADRGTMIRKEKRSTKL